MAINEDEVIELFHQGLLHREIADTLDYSEGRVWQILNKHGYTKVKQTPQERLLSKTSFNPTTECWEFTGDRDMWGYGRLTVKGKTYRANRLAYEFFVGKIPKGFIVCHRCDNPPCCNPEHLFLGTHADNMIDKVSKGRQAKGKGLPQTKLEASAASQAKYLKEQGLSFRAIGKLLSCSHTHAQRLCKSTE